MGTTKESFRNRDSKFFFFFSQIRKQLPPPPPFPRHLNSLARFKLSSHGNQVLRHKSYDTISHTSISVAQFLNITLFINLQISKRNDIIRRLKNDIYNVEKNAEEQSRRIITEAAKQDASEMKTSDSKKSKLQQEIIELKKKLEGDTLAHRESELALRKVLPVVTTYVNFSLAAYLNPVNLNLNI